MPGLLDDAAGTANPAEEALQQARQAWEKSMTRQLEELRSIVRCTAPEIIADRCGGRYSDAMLEIDYWGNKLRLAWPDLIGVDVDNKPVSTFDIAMLLYHFNTADGAPLADRWISFRELPGGTFYNKAYQGYTGDELARTFGDDPDRFAAAARTLNGMQISGLTEFAYAFTPLPRLRLAAVIWPGDEDFPSRGSVLFDAASKHYLTTDGLALLGSGLTKRLIAAAS